MMEIAGLLYTLLRDEDPGQWSVIREAGEKVIYASREVFFTFQDGIVSVQTRRPGHQNKYKEFKCEGKPPWKRPKVVRTAHWFVVYESDHKAPQSSFLYLSSDTQQPFSFTVRGSIAHISGSTTLDEFMVEYTDQEGQYRHKAFGPSEERGQWTWVDWPEIDQNTKGIPDHSHDFYLTAHQLFLSEGRWTAVYPSSSLQIRSLDPNNEEKDIIHSQLMLPEPRHLEAAGPHFVLLSFHQHLEVYAVTDGKELPASGLPTATITVPTGFHLVSVCRDPPVLYATNDQGEVRMLSLMQLVVGGTLSLELYDLDAVSLAHNMRQDETAFAATAEVAMLVNYTTHDVRCCSLTEPGGKAIVLEWKFTTPQLQVTPNWLFLWDANVTGAVSWFLACPRPFPLSEWKQIKLKKGEILNRMKTSSVNDLVLLDIVGGEEEDKKPVKRVFDPVHQSWQEWKHRGMWGDYSADYPDHFPRHEDVYTNPPFIAHLEHDLLQIQQLPQDHKNERYVGTNKEIVAHGTHFVLLLDKSNPLQLVYLPLEDQGSTFATFPLHLTLPDDQLSFIGSDQQRRELYFQHSADRHVWRLHLQTLF